MTTLSAEERFWAKVDKRGPDDCWLWTAATFLSGYGAFYPGGGRRAKKRLMAAHRFSWQLVHGPIPNGLQVCHNCPGGDNRPCVNPSHLFLGTQKDNIRDMFAKGRQGGQFVKRQGETCPRGHAFTHENTYLAPRGFKVCRTCRLEQTRAFERRHPERARRRKRRGPQRAFS